MPHNFKISLSFLAMLLMAALPASAVETAEQILSRAADKIAKAPSVTMNFTLSYNGQSSQSSLVIAKNKYRLSSAGLEVWYDGETLWSLNTADSEVSITDPTPDELLECNPFAIISHYKANFTYRRLGGATNDIELVAKRKGSAIRKAVITIDPKTYMPSKLIVTMSNGRTFSAKITSATVGKALPASTFVYNKTKFPAKSVIDLR